MNKTAATWASQMLFTEPLKVIGAIQANGRTEMAWLLVLVMASQLLAYLLPPVSAVMVDMASRASIT